jgi:heme-degrading monooxygenase HmoA
MSDAGHSTTNGHIFRVDKFVVSPQAMDEFMQRVRQTHELLRQQPGFIRDAVLEQSSGPGEFNIVTIAEWQGQDAVDKARTVVKARHQSQGFDPQMLMKRLGIRADIGNYRSVDGGR